MSQSNGNIEPHELPRELPPVEPPTAGFIVQLFVIPAIVVAVIVGVWLLFGELAGGHRDAMDYVRTIRSENENRRWRAAYELASLIQNDAKLASDPTLLGELTLLLGEELDRSQGEAEDRTASYLAHTLGAFPTAEARSVRGEKVDPLATLGRALGPRQPLEVRIAAAQSLGRIGARLPDGLDDPNARKALIAALTDDKPEVRQRVAYSLGYVRGEEAAEALRGRLAGDEDPFVRFNAAAALARRGDPAAERVVKEMLSPADLARVIRGDSPSEANRRIEAIELEALWALQAAVRNGKPDLARSVRPDIAALVRESTPHVRVEAETLLKKLPDRR